MRHNRLLYLIETAKMLTEQCGSRRAAAFLRENRVSLEAALWILARAAAK